MRVPVVHMEVLNDLPRAACGDVPSTKPRLTRYAKRVTCPKCKNLDPQPVKLIAAIGHLRNELLQTVASGQAAEDLGNTANLLKVLQGILKGQEPLKAFGAAGDWGYETPIGKALLSALRGEG